MYQKTNWNRAQNTAQQRERSGLSSSKQDHSFHATKTDNEKATFKKKIKSWRYISFFKKNGLLIKFSFSQQTIYLSFVKKTTDTKYQSFTDGFVVKLSLDSLNELLYCLALEPPQQWDTWREKNGEKYHVFFTPIPLKDFTLMSGTRINLPATALNLKVQHRSGVIHNFTLSPSEANLIIDAFQAFRNQILQNIITNKIE